MVIDCLKSGLTKAAEIAASVEKKVGTIRQMLSQLFKAGLVVRPARGVYEIA